ncbi:MAG: hypothetical protein AB1758_08560 [Candidatus Eremiobacterota bacterium]
MKVQNFQIGTTPLDPRTVNEKTLQALAESAPSLQLDGAKEIGKLAERWLKTGTISEEEHAQLREFGKKAYGYKKRLDREWWALRPLDKNKSEAEMAKQRAVEAKLAPARIFLAHERSVSDGLREANALAMVQGLAGASFGPVGTLAAYVAWNDLNEESTRAVLEKLGGLQKGDSAMIYGGNKVEQVHQEKLWPAIISMLDEGLEMAKAGQPVEVDLQYYELTSADVLGKVRELAEAGARVRINVDPALRLSYPDQDDRYDVDDVPLKFRSILQLTQLAQQDKLDVAVSVYPASKELGDSTNLMHRKILRVNNKVLLSGMNANLGSGENVDAGYIIEGPAAAGLVKNFKRDCEQSKGVSPEDIFGEGYWKDLQEATLTMGRRGLTGVLDCLSGVQPAGEEVKPLESFPDLKRRCDEAGFDVMKFFDVPEDEFLDKMQKLLSGEEDLPLSPEGKATCAKLFRMTMEAVQRPGNQKRIDQIDLPSDKKVGQTAVAIADTPDEREAMMIHAISQADKFVYLPAFVITRGVAAAIAARKEELAAQGKELDVKVIADPGVYPRGDTPNSWGVKFLEDCGIETRWALLPRTGWHDRKIHAKQLITDKHEMFGSTNFSKKGMRENWETSGLVFFDPADPDSIKNRDESVAAFLSLWENESFELNSIALATVWKTRLDSPDKAQQIEEARDGVIKKVIKQIEVVEEESAQWMVKQAQDPTVAAAIEKLEKDGMSEGYAIYLAVKDHLGEDEFYAQLAKLPARQELERMKPRKRAEE